MAERLVESKLISREAYTSFTVLNLFAHGRGFLNDFLIYASEGLVKWTGICETNLFIFVHMRFIIFISCFFVHKNVP